MQRFRRAVEGYAADRQGRTAAALAYYSLFSIVPLLFIAVGVAGFVVPDARGEIRSQLSDWLPPATVEFLDGMIDGVVAGRGLAFALAVVLAVWASTGVFFQLQGALDDVFRIPHSVARGFGPWVRRRLVAVLVSVSTGGLVIVTFLVNAAVGLIRQRFGGRLSWIGHGWSLASPLLTAVVLLGVFSLVFRYLPAVRPGWRAVRAGAVFTTPLFVASAFGGGWFLARFGLGGVIGGASSLAVFAIIVHVLAQVTLLGAEFTRVWQQDVETVVPGEAANVVEEE